MYPKPKSLIFYIIVTVHIIFQTGLAQADKLDEEYFNNSVKNLHRFFEYSKQAQSRFDYVSVLPDSVTSHLDDTTIQKLKKQSSSFSVIEKSTFGIQIVGKGKIVTIEPTHRFGTFLINKKLYSWDSRLSTIGNIKKIGDRIRASDSASYEFQFFRLLNLVPPVYAKVRYDYDEDRPDLEERVVNIFRDDQVAIGALAAPVVAPITGMTIVTIVEMVERLWQPSYWTLLQDLKMSVEVGKEVAGESIIKFSGPLTLTLGLFYANNAQPTVKCGMDGSFELRHGAASFDDHWDKARQFESTFLRYERVEKDKFKLDFKSEQSKSFYPMFNNDSIKRFFKIYMENLGFKVNENDPRLEHYTNMVSREFRTISNRCSKLNPNDQFMWHFTALQKIEARLQAKKMLLRSGPCANPADTFEGKHCSPADTKTNVAE